MHDETAVLCLLFMSRFGFFGPLIDYQGFGYLSGFVQ
jgi:hypothetical protein